MKKLVWLTFKHYDNYSRKHLICSIIKNGDYEVLYINIREQVFISINGTKEIDCFDYKTSNYSRIIKNIKEFAGKDNLIVWSAFIFCFWKIFLLIRFNFLKAHFIYYVYDYLFYDEKHPYTLLKFKIIDKIFQLCSNKIVVNAKKLQELYKNSYWLNNASHIQKGRTDIVHNRIGLIGSLDERCDLDLLDSIVKKLPNIEFDIYGWVFTNDKFFKEKFDNLLNSNRNITYHGEYKNDDLNKILSTFDIGLAPYTLGHIMTEYIDLDKYRHYLCFGLEVVTSPIPAAMELKSSLHICNSGDEFVKAIENIYAKKGLKNTGEFWKENNWNARYKEIDRHIFP